MGSEIEMFYRSNLHWLSALLFHHLCPLFIVIIFMGVYRKFLKRKWIIFTSLSTDLFSGLFLKKPKKLSQEFTKYNFQSLSKFNISCDWWIFHHLELFFSPKALTEYLWLEFKINPPHWDKWSRTWCVI